MELGTIKDFLEKLTVKEKKINKEFYNKRDAERTPIVLTFLERNYDNFCLYKKGRRLGPMHK